MTDEKQALLWHSNAPHAGTGYGNQTALFTPRLKDQFRVGVSAFYGIEGNILPWNGMPVYPARGSMLDANVEGNATVHFEDGLRDGLVVSLMDVWPLNPEIWSQFNWVAWTPIDHDPLPEAVSAVLRVGGGIPMAMSKFGLEKLHQAQFDDALYCPHGVDTSLLKPKDRKAARKRLMFPEDAFVVGMVAANKGNPSRKCFPEALLAFKHFRNEHPEALLYMHTEAQGIMDGVDIPKLMRNVGLPIESVRFPDQYRILNFPHSEDYMADAYSMMDVLLAPSAGEGFGIPVVEAQACGTPVIASDFSAQPELVGAGWLCDGVRHYTAAEAYQFLPSVDEILDALRRCYGLSTAQYKTHRDKAREFALGYDIEKVMAEHMLPALTEASERFGSPPPELEMLRDEDEPERPKVTEVTA